MKVTLVKGKFTVSQDRKGAAHIMCNVCGDKDVLPKQETMTDEEYEVALQKHFQTAMKHVPPGVGSLKTAKQLLETGKSGNLAKFFNENETASGDRSLANVTAELDKPSPRVLKPMLVAPMMLNGRPMGLQPVICFYCGQVGLINCEAERPAPHGYKLAITSLNEDPRSTRGDACQGFLYRTALSGFYVRHNAAGRRNKANTADVSHCLSRGHDSGTGEKRG
jgi:hypothetical protein